jgi:hypothetical protein
VTDTADVYDVLNTRTSEKNGLAAAPTGNDVTAGNVTVPAETKAGSASETAQRKTEGVSLFTGTSGA